MQKVLITGGAGFIPSSFAEKLLSTGRYSIVAIDNFLTGKRENLSIQDSNYTFIKADVNNYRDISSIMLNHHFDFVFHYAAVVGVKRTIENPHLVLEDIKGLQNIFDLSKNTGVKRIFFSSSLVCDSCTRNFLLVLLRLFLLFSYSSKAICIFFPMYFFS